jgi:hypothetical protein
MAKVLIESCLDHTEQNLERLEQKNSRAVE